MKRLLQHIINMIGYETHKYPGGELRRRKNVIAHYQINKVFDVGANIGQFGKELRRVGFSGDILSFEPMGDVYQKLVARAAKDDTWQTFNHAMGSHSGKSKINVAGNSFSSSILDMLPQHEEAAPESAFSHQLDIVIKTMDEVFPKLVKDTDRCYLKIDTQGFESEVLKGAEQSLQQFVAVQLEMSLIPLYKDERLFNEMMAFMQNNGFRIHSLEPGLDDPKTGRLLQLDGIFVNTNFD